MTDELNIDYENFVALIGVQAALGNISDATQGVALEVRGAHITLYVLVAARTAAIDEDIDDIVADIEGLMHPSVVDVDVVITESPADWPGRTRRMIFLRREA